MIFFEFLFKKLFILHLLISIPGLTTIFSILCGAAEFNQNLRKTKFLFFAIFFLIFISSSQQKTLALSLLKVWAAEQPVTPIP